MPKFKLKKTRVPLKILALLVLVLGLLAVIILVKQNQDQRSWAKKDLDEQTRRGNARKDWEGGGGSSYYCGERCQQCRKACPEGHNGILERGTDKCLCCEIQLKAFGGQPDCFAIDL